MKKVVVLCYSLTGNTKHISFRISTELEKTGRFSVTILDLIPLVRSVVFSGATTASPSIPCSEVNAAHPIPLVSEAYEALEQADVIGVGVLVWCFLPPPGVREFLQQVIVCYYLVVTIYNSYRTACSKKSQFLLSLQRGKLRYLPQKML